MAVKIALDPFIIIMDERILQITRRSFQENVFVDQPRFIAPPPRAVTDAYSSWDTSRRV